MIVLLAAATVATLADVAAYLALVAPGFVPEANPIVAGLSIAAALWARAAVIALLVSLTVLASIRPERRLRLAVRAALVLAIAVGILGAASTVAATL